MPYPTGMISDFRDLLILQYLQRLHRLSIPNLKLKKQDKTKKMLQILKVFEHQFKAQKVLDFTHFKFCSFGLGMLNLYLKILSDK
jgi:hypothetical protein